MKSWVEISRERLVSNFSALLNLVREGSGGNTQPGTAKSPALLAVIKANAYGHGIDPCTAILADAGAEWLGVTDASEGAAVRELLRSAKFAEAKTPQILVMCGTAGLPREAEQIIESGLVSVVWSEKHVERLGTAATKAALGAPVKVHLEIDTGMSRQGVRPGADLDAVLNTIKRWPGLALDGVFTHYASTEVAHSPQTAKQQEQFEAAVEQVLAAGVRPQWLHVGNSSYIDNCTGDHPLFRLRLLAERAGARSMIRSGLALYGYLLPITGEGRSLVSARVLPVMTWKTYVIGLSEVPRGAAIGYNATYTAARPMLLAILPVGYADGFRRELSSSNDRGGGWVLINGSRAPVVGRVSMNLLSVDVSDIASVNEGDEAVLLGDGVTAEDHARLAETIAYEILCGVRADRRLTKA